MYDPQRIVNVRGISSGTERTIGETEMKLSTENHKTTHVFHIVGYGIRIPYDGILGQDFLVSKRAKIHYKKREFIMGGVRLQFDDKVSTDETGKPISIILKARCQTVVKVPMKSQELKVGLLVRLSNYQELLWLKP